jgi:hypothetical protein
MGCEPEFTNYTSKFKGTLDYIFYTHTRLRIMAVTSIPEAAEIQASSGEGLPSACYPSDHVSLCCDVAMIPSGSGSILSTEHNSASRLQHIPSMMRTHNSTSNLVGSAGPTTSTMSLLRAHSSTSNLTGAPISMASKPIGSRK